MAELRYQADTQEIILDLLMGVYRHLTNAEYIDALLDALSHYDADRVLAAVRAHMANTGLGAGTNEPIGHFPPSAADILLQLQQQDIAARRAAQDAENRARAAESDRTGERVLHKLDWPCLTGEWGRKRAEITAALRADLNLDLTRWADCQILWAVHKAWTDSCWRPDPNALVYRHHEHTLPVHIGWLPSGREMTVPQCVELGRQLVAERDGVAHAEAAG